MWRRLDPVLAIALILALVFSIYGIRWGRVECWNRDQMALRPLHLNWRPFSYAKPPFHTYLNHLIVLRPIAQAQFLRQRVFGQRANLNEARLLGSRLLVVALFLGTIALAFSISRQAYGLFAARVIALLLATSAGFIAYDHFLSCDSPLLFWMMLTLFFVQRIYTRGQTADYILAGFLTGISTATKYNGLAVGIAMVTAHFLSKNKSSLPDRLLNKRLVLGLGMVAVGFIAGNPYSIFDWKKFSADFIYNYKVTPVYGGQTAGHGYGQFLARLSEILGLPGAILIAVAVLSSFTIVLIRRDLRGPAGSLFAITGSVFLLYFMKFGSFPRMETRFVLPAVPLSILMAGPFFNAIATKQKWAYSVLVPLLLYNCLCCFYVGKRFTQDPRTSAQFWIERHCARGLIVESSAGSPHWHKLPKFNAVESDAEEPNWNKAQRVDVIDLRMPHASGRPELFARIFQDDPWIRQHAPDYEDEANERLFTFAELSKRKPDLITVYSADYQVPSAAVRNYYSDLLQGKFPYDIVFDGQTRRPPRWVYPRNIDFLDGRIAILARRPGPR